MSRGRKTKTEETYLCCPECEHVVTIHRRKSKLREKNHVKHMWCVRCKEVTGHIEKKEDLFLPEWLRNGTEYRLG